LAEPSVEEKIRICLEHLKLNVQYKDEEYGVKTFRKHYVGYLKGLPNIAPVRSELMQFTTQEQVINRLQKYLSEIHEKV
jgi:tRNA-dihydrouridine synthase